jgi:hypothetical protein
MHGHMFHQHAPQVGPTHFHHHHVSLLMNWFNVCHIEVEWDNVQPVQVHAKCEPCPEVLPAFVNHTTSTECVEVRIEDYQVCDMFPT